MSDNKKYYYMKLKENFFDSDEMIILESMTDGYLYSNILMKLYLRSLKDNGRLMFKGVIPYTSDVLSRVLRHNVGVVEKAIQVFKQLELIEILDNGAIYMLDIQNFIGESSTEADRIRAYRKKVDEQKLLTSGQTITNAVTNVRTDVQQTYDKSTPELDIDLELELDSKKNKIDVDSNEYDLSFERWYSSYPKKGSVRKEAYKKFVSLWKSKKIDMELLMKGTADYIAYQKSKGFNTCGAQVFLNQERWNDDWTLEADGNGSSTVARTGRASYRKDSNPNGVTKGQIVGVIPGTDFGF